MSNQFLSHEDATALTAGIAPQGRADLETLAAAIHDFRDAFAESAPQPSPELAGWLTGVPAPPQQNLGPSATAATAVRARRGPLRQRAGRALGALAGLGVTAKLALGGTAALAAITTAGFNGALPQAPQTMFDRIFDTQETDKPASYTPSDPIPETDTPIGTGAEDGAGEQPVPTRSTSEPQPRGDDDGTLDTTRNQPPRGGGEPAEDTDGPDDADDSDSESQDRPDNESEDRPESNDEPDFDDGSGDGDRRGSEDTEKNDGRDDPADVDGSSNSNDNAEHVEAETVGENSD